MKITKFVHSCIIAEKDGVKILVDPGNYSWQSGMVPTDGLKDIHAVVITHGHPDHFYEEFVRAVAGSSPSAAWYGPAEVVAQLNEWGIEGQTTSSDPLVRFIESEHADLSPWFHQQPEHSSFVVHDELLIGGDCHTLNDAHGARIFGAAVSGGPWGAVVGFSKMIEAMSTRPEVVIPLHDWHLQDEARKGIYGHLPEVMQEFDVTFVPLENGVSQEV